MSGEWLTSNRASKRPRASAQDAFADDWGTYEKVGSHGNGVGGAWAGASSTAAASASASAHRQVRKPSAPGRASSVRLPYSPKGPSAGGGNGWNHSRRGGFPGGGGGGPSLPPTAGPGGARESLNAAAFRDSMANPEPTATLPDEEASSLSPEQRRVVESILSGHSTFFSGPAGSGKSHVLSSVVRLNEEGLIAPKKRIVITATTGIAACNVGGTTINSFAGVGTGDLPLPDMFSRVMGNQYAKQRWREVDILVIDEVSMMPGGFLDKLDMVASRARSDRRPFGGIQLVLCGDFFQLPPIKLEKNVFAFEAKCWSKVIKCSILLKRVYRQGGDPALMDILNEARVGELSEASVHALRTHSALGNAGQRWQQREGGSEAAANIQPTLLECRNAQVDRANFREMAKLPGETHTFKARDRAVNKVYEAQLKHCQAPESLDLKVGSQVILLKNIDPDHGLVNGSRGVIVDFQTHPKSNNDMPREFKKVELPVVQFEAINAVGSKDAEGDEEEDEKDGEDDLLKLIEPAEWTNKVGDNTVSSRVQIPLRLAWALSVHKSQGMTIPHLAVNLRGVFEYGQAYVALSRATELRLLTLQGFEERAFRAHPKVKQFYRLLEGKEPVGPEADGRRGDGRKQPASSDGVGRSAAAQGGSDSSSARASLTDEQRKRMEENRLRALEIRRKKQEQAAAAGVAAVAGSSGSKESAPNFFGSSAAGERGVKRHSPLNPYARS